MSEKVFCEKCGAEMHPIDPAKPIGMICPKCGWGWATSYIDPIAEDAADYTVTLLDGNAVSGNAVKVVAEIARVNYLQGKKMIKNAPSVVLVGRAVAVRSALTELTGASIRYKVEPPFPYHFDKSDG